jgi:hypothetical protein
MKLGVLVFIFASFGVTFAQNGQWITYSHDPQRSGFSSDEHAFSPANVSNLGLQWKTVVPNNLYS